MRRFLFLLGLLIASPAFAQFSTMVQGSAAAPPTPTTWDPARVGAGITLSGGDLIAAGAAVTEAVISTTSKASGKYYAEVTITAVGTSNAPGVCLFNNSVVVTSLGGGYGGGDTTAICMYNNGQILWNNGSAGCGGTSAFTTGDVIGVAVDFANISPPNVFFYINGSVSTPCVSTLVPSGALFIGASPFNGATETLNTCNSGCSIPSGYTKWGP